MKEFFIALAIAAIGGAATIAWNHPAGYRRLVLGVFSLGSLASAFLIGVRMAYDTAIIEIGAGASKPAIILAIRNRLGSSLEWQFWVWGIAALSLVLWVAPYLFKDRGKGE